MSKRVFIYCGIMFVACGFILACPFNDELREYLSAHFWLPFAKWPASFERPNVRRISAPFAGMADAKGDSPMPRLRAAYQQMAVPESAARNAPPLPTALAAVRIDKSLTPREKEEVERIDAK